MKKNNADQFPSKQESPFDLKKKRSLRLKPKHAGGAHGTHTTAPSAENGF